VLNGEANESLERYRAAILDNGDAAVKTREDLIALARVFSASTANLDALIDKMIPATSRTIGLTEAYNRLRTAAQGTFAKLAEGAPKDEGPVSPPAGLFDVLGASGAAVESMFVGVVPALTDALAQAGPILTKFTDEATREFNSFSGGVSAATDQYLESLSDRNLGFGAASEAFGALEGGIDQFSTALANGEKDFSQFAKGLIKQLAAIAIKTLALKAIGGIFGGAGTAGGNSAGGGLLGALGFATGGVGPGPLVASAPLGNLPIKAYANGGIARSPQVGIFGEGRSNEAFVPLPDGKRIPVEDRGGGGAMTINLQVESLDPKRASDVILENMPQIQAQLAASIMSGSDGKLARAVGRG